MIPAPCQLDELIKYSRALLTPVIGIIAVRIAYQQYATASARLRLDLFERRIAVYEALMLLLGRILQAAAITELDLSAFLESRRQSRFLFGTDISLYLEEVYNKAVRVSYVFKRLKDASDSNQLTSLANQEDELVQWFRKQLDVAPDKFSAYLTMQRLGWMRRVSRRLRAC